MPNSFVNAMPNLNGDTADTFRREGREVAEVAVTAQARIREMNLESLSGRNYQHCSDPVGDRQQDVQRLQNAMRALADLEQLGIDIYLAGGNN